jgi:molecular chaperone GrpE
MDDFERAFAALPAELRRLTWVEGVYMIWNKTLAIFEARGLTPIEATGRDFDPREHEAVMREDDSDPSEQTVVVAELQRGYRFHDRVLRPTLVKVGRPPAAGADGGVTTAGTTEEPTTAGGAGAAPDSTEAGPTVG